jgi:DNA-binding XRE family transcriptional regulator
MPDIKPELRSAKLYALYARSGKTMAQIAQDCGISTSSISKIIANKRRPSLETAVDLARSLGVSVQTVVDAAGMRWGRVKHQLGEDSQLAA